MSPLEEIKRLTDETYQHYFRRVLKKVTEEQMTYVICLGGFKYLEVTVETTYDYLKGYFEATFGPLP